jgi:hypothetical protein
MPNKGNPREEEDRLAEEEEVEKVSREWRSIRFGMS